MGVVPVGTPAEREDDREDAVALNEAVQDALQGGDAGALAAATAELEELLFFIEGR